MTFNASSGTRGARQPRSSPFANWVNTRMVNRIRRRGGKLGGVNLLVLNTVGKKTGAQRANPVGWFPAEGGGWMVVASAAGGAKNPAWFYNLAANPDSVSIDVDRANVLVTAEPLHGNERDRAWASVVALSPRFAQYEAKTDRLIPIVRLRPRG